MDAVLILPIGLIALGLGLFGFATIGLALDTRRRRRQQRYFKDW